MSEKRPIDVFEDRDRPGLRWHLKSAFRSFIGETFLKRPPPKKPAARKLLNMGCGPKRFEGFVNADFYSTRLGFSAAARARRPDWMVDVRRRLNCPDGYWDGIFTEHMIEHLTYRDARFAFSELYRVLKPGGWLRVTVPNLQTIAEFYVAGTPVADAPRHWELPAEAVADLVYLWGHQSVWDGELMVRTLSDLGFQDASTFDHLRGNDPDLLRDDPEKEWETLYVEARKPI